MYGSGAEVSVQVKEKTVYYCMMIVKFDFVSMTFLSTLLHEREGFFLIFSSIPGFFFVRTIILCCICNLS